MPFEGFTVTSSRDPSAGDPFAPAASETKPESDDIKRRRLESARRAVDRRLKDERRRKRRARRVRRRVKCTIGGLVFLNLIAFLGLETPSDPLSIWTYIGVDKLEHLIALIMLAAVLIPLLARWLSPALTLLTVTLFGLVTEITQAYSPGRTPDFADFVADQVGILIGWWIGVWILGKLRAHVAEDDEAAGHQPRRRR